jgi:threonine/homoserine/homoserine lactone efflux protein
MESLSGFLLAALALTGSPGPNTLSIAAVSGAFGRLNGLRYMAGLMLGMVFVMAIVGSGVSGILLALPGAAPAITGLAAAYFLYLAYRIATAPPVRTGGDAGSSPKWFAGTFQSLVNPKAYAAMAALFSSFVLVADDRLGDSLVKAGVVTLTLFAVNIAWLFLGSALTQVMRDAIWCRVVNVTFAILLLLSVAAAVLV